jgi:hypothetical protein
MVDGIYIERNGVVDVSLLYTGTNVTNGIRVARGGFVNWSQVWNLTGGGAQHVFDEATASGLGGVSGRVPS